MAMVITGPIWALAFNVAESSASTSPGHWGITASLGRSAPSSFIRSRVETSSSSPGVFSKSWRDTTRPMCRSLALRASRRTRSSPAESSTSSREKPPRSSRFQSNSS